MAQAPAQHRRTAGASAPVRTGDRAGRPLCPCCSGPMQTGSARRSEEAPDRVPARLWVLCTIRPKYASPRLRGSGSSRPPAPARLRGRHGTTALIASHATAKYAWQSTLYRQAQILAARRRRGPSDAGALDGEREWMAKAVYDLQLVTTWHGFERCSGDEDADSGFDPGRGRTKVCQFRRMRRTIAPGRVLLAAVAMARGRPRQEGGS